MDVSYFVTFRQYQQKDLYRAGLNYIGLKIGDAGGRARHRKKTGYVWVLGCAYITYYKALSLVYFVHSLLYVYYCFIDEKPDVETGSRRQE